MVFKEVVDYLHGIAPNHFQEDYDNAGLIVGAYDTEIKGVLVSLDATEEVIDEAIERGCNLIVAHHPIVFRGLKRFNGSDYVEKAIIKAIKNDIGIFAIHTNLDNVLHQGVNGRIAEKIGLKDCKILRPKAELEWNGQAVGSGLIGDIGESTDAISFLEELKKRMDLQVIKHTKIVKESVRKVAVCGGSGSFLLKDAIRGSADIFITSDYKYHEFFDANGRIVIVDIGHYESEKYTIDLLQELLSQNFSNFAAHCTNSITNPIFYL